MMKQTMKVIGNAELDSISGGGVLASLAGGAVPYDSLGSVTAEMTAEMMATVAAAEAKALAATVTL